VFGVTSSAVGCVIVIAPSQLNIVSEALIYPSPLRV
jgi:hypothetical protein